MRVAVGSMNTSHGSFVRQMTRWSRLWKSAGITEKTAQGLRYIMPTAVQSKMVKNNPPLRKAMQQGTDAGIFDTAQDTILGDAATARWKWAPTAR